MKTLKNLMQKLFNEEKRGKYLLRKITFENKIFRKELHQVPKFPFVDLKLKKSLRGKKDLKEISL